MSNFDLRKYLAEGKLLKEEYDSEFNYSAKDKADYLATIISTIGSGWYLTNGLEIPEQWKGQISAAGAFSRGQKFSQMGLGSDLKSIDKGDPGKEKLMDYYNQSKNHLGLNEEPDNNIEIDSKAIAKGLSKNQTKEYNQGEIDQLYKDPIVFRILDDVTGRKGREIFSIVYGGSKAPEGAAAEDKAK